MTGKFWRKRIARGILTPIKTAKSGKSFYCLQYTRARKHVTRCVPSAETRMWLREIAASGYLDAKRLALLVGESLELPRIRGASFAAARRRLREEGEDFK